MLARVKDILLNIEMGVGVTHQNLWMVPLYGGATPGLEYFSIDEAIGHHLLEVTEVSESGDVPNLKVSNKGERPILILAGEELVGAKQNRLVNATFLIAGLTSIVMPVSCVEQGRWHYRGKEFQSERRMSSPQLRSKVEQNVKYAIREGRGFRANQGEVWNEISNKMARMKVQSPTMAMAAMYDSYNDQLRGYTESFKQAERQQGLIMAINGQVAGLELFDSPGSLSKYFEKLLVSYALDAIDLKEGMQPTNQLEARARTWIAELMEVPVRTRPSLGLGYDIRLEGEQTTGSGLLYENSVLYLSAFALVEPSERREGSAFARYGLRRRL
jgi:hypothetical protein